MTRTNIPKSPSAVAEAEPAAQAAASPDRGRLIVPLGRGARGKTWWTRWAVERAQQAGRPVVLADADRTNATLSAYFGDVLAPPSADEADMRDWLTAFCERLIERRLAALVDLGGGDLLLKHLAREGLAEFLDTNGAEAVAVHLIGPDRDDLAYLRDLEQDRLFAPRATVLVLNEALVPAGRSLEAAFAGVLEHPIFRAAVERGAVPVWMPRLKPAHEVDDRRLTFAAAEAGQAGTGQAPLGLWNRQLVANWRRQMEANFAPVAAWLP
ncbi:hypothetical protein [Roseomonas mucosa]|uniref:hypothetical protein n=1 Tax=Roseomonas mucosa TaxID=207340 RepID=UPI00224616E3|nr:hypothetical protein [Roseomonas mucosa]UZO94917.1 Hypothetical protein RMP42_04533 [Roseomonas mucosa]